MADIPDLESLMGMLTTPADRSAALSQGLIAAGAGLLGSRSPKLGPGLAQGAMSGMGAYNQALQQRQQDRMQALQLNMLLAKMAEEQRKRKAIEAAKAGMTPQQQFAVDLNPTEAGKRVAHVAWPEEQMPTLQEITDPRDPLKKIKVWLKPGEVMGAQVGGAAMPEILDPRVQEARRKIAEAGRSQMSQTAIMGKPDNKYLETRLQGRAEDIRKLEASAASSWNQVKSIDRFVDASKKGFEGGAAPVMAMTANFLASFGYRPEGLKDVAVMQQAVGDILANKMSELGARGLTDRDMDVLREALPRIGTSREARQTVAEIVKQSHLATLREFEAAKKAEASAYPDLQSRIPQPTWFNEYSGYKDRGGSDTARTVQSDIQEAARAELRRRGGR